MAGEQKKKPGCLLYLLTFVILAGAGWVGSKVLTKEADKIANEEAIAIQNLKDGEITDDIKIQVVTYAQIELKRYIDGAKFPWNMDEYTVIRGGDRFKIEGTVSGARFWVILEWDFKKNADHYYIRSVQVGDQKYKSE